MERTKEQYSKGGLRKNTQGSAAAEFAMVLPLLIIFLAVVLDFGRLMMDYHAASKSIRDASRYLTRVEVTCDAAGGAVDNAQNIVIAKNLALSGSVGTPVAGDYLLSYWTDPGSISITVTCIENLGQFSGRYEQIAYIPSITVTATVPFTMLFGVIVYSGPQLSFVTTTNMVWMSI
ncbi:MAG: pilus assembly protein [Emcibacter sp.]|nr:pilus assembly protein [Emcibacter sp.]